MSVVILPFLKRVLSLAVMSSEQVIGGDAGNAVRNRSSKSKNQNEYFGLNLTSRGGNKRVNLDKLAKYGM